MAIGHFILIPLVFLQIHHALPDEGQLNWAKLDKNEESVALNADLDKLNIVEKTLLAEHIMRTTYQLCNYQKKFSIPNGHGHSIPLSWLNREKPLDNPVTGCAYSESKWDNEKKQILSVMDESIHPNCMEDFPLQNSVAAFKQLDGMKECNCKAFSQVQGSANGMVCKMEYKNLSNAMENILRVFTKVLNPILKRNRQWKLGQSFDSEWHTNGEEFNVLLSYLFKIAIDHLTHDNPYLEELAKWFKRQFERFTGVNYDEEFNNDDSDIDSDKSIQSKIKLDEFIERKKDEEIRQTLAAKLNAKNRFEKNQQLIAEKFKGKIRKFPPNRYNAKHNLKVSLPLIIPVY